MHTAWIFIVLVTIAATGCGDGRPQRVPVSGTVKIDGNPVPVGFIRVIPSGDRMAQGQIGPDGRFTLNTFGDDDGCVLGKHQVEIVALEVIDAGSQRWHAPKEYSNKGTSGLTAEITEPTDSLLIELTWNGGQPFIERFDESSDGPVDEGL